MKKFGKKLVSAILTIILLILSTPWIATKMLGAITGSFLTMFMSGIKKGEQSASKIIFNLKYLEIKGKEANKKESDLKIVEKK